MKKLCFLVLLSLVVAAGCSKDDDLGLRQDVTGQFDPFFAQELQKRGYVADAKHITPAEVKDITRLNVGRGESTSLRGIEYFESLTFLDCSLNQLTSLDVSKNRALTHLSCELNQLATLNVGNNTMLETLNCASNQLTVLDVGSNTELKILHCSSNRLTSLDVSRNMALTYLDCHQNPGEDAIFSVTAWFDNDDIPSGFPTGNWLYYGESVRIDYRKAE